MAQVVGHLKAIIGQESTSYFLLCYISAVFLLYQKASTINRAHANKGKQKKKRSNIFFIFYIVARWEQCIGSQFQLDGEIKKRIDAVAGWQKEGSVGPPLQDIQAGNHWEYSLSICGKKKNYPVILLLVLV